MSIFMKIAVVIIMNVSLVGVFTEYITFMEFIAGFYGGLFLFMYNANYLGKP